MDAIDDRAEALLMAADRAQHVAELIRPALEAGRDVVCDRFVGSSLAYQGHGRGLGVEPVAALSRFATDDLAPDVVILLDVPAAVAVARRPGGPDRLEAAGPDFHARVRAGYLALAAADPERWVVIDGAAPVDDVVRARRRRRGRPPPGHRRHRLTGRARPRISDASGGRPAVGRPTSVPAPCGHR